MKIVSVMTSEQAGGAEFGALQLLSALRERGHEVVSLSNQPAPEGFDVPVRPIALGPKLSARSWPGLLARWPWLVLRLRRALEAERPYDALIVHYKKEQLLAARLPAALRRGLVWREWGPVPLQMRRGIARLLYARAARPATWVMAVSSGTRDSVCAAGVAREKVRVVPNVVPVESAGFTEDGRARIRREGRIDADAIVVGCVSRLDAKKRNDVLVDAMCRLGRSDVHLLLAGDGPEKAALAARAAPLGDRAHFLHTPGARISEVMSACDLAVFCPSPTEGAPLAVIFAMLAGRPCLATAREGVTDMIHPGAGQILNPEHDPEALAVALRAYLDDPERRAREGEAARAFAVRSFAPEAVADQVLELLGDTRAGG